eukprot:TRINITY_DN15204_c2_g4_i1.p1 TRINITY_DN15204_c2_g4~~TRINITY_DN15204_c2_g4_i1.p1  ORF type:complete len:315 (-),score=70.91 TRINITY_DN15204_c2_g4_i1:123-1067(-)
MPSKGLMKAAMVAGLGACTLDMVIGFASPVASRGMARPSIAGNSLEAAPQIRSRIAAAINEPSSFVGAAPAAGLLSFVAVTTMAGLGLRREKANGSRRVVQLKAEPKAPSMPMISTGSSPIDVMSRLLQDRVLFLNGQVNDEMANVLVAQILYLANQDAEKDITIYINSPGGSVSAGMAIFDAMTFVPCQIQTVCLGMAASMGAFLLGAGTKGKRKSLPNSRIMIHQPLGGAGGQAADIEIQAKEILFLRDILNTYISDFTSKELDKVAEDTERDYYMTPEEAVTYGIIDEVVETKSWPRLQKPDKPSLANGMF